MVIRLGTRAGTKPSASRASQNETLRACSPLAGTVGSLSFWVMTLLSDDPEYHTASSGRARSVGSTKSCNRPIAEVRIRSSEHTPMTRSRLSQTEPWMTALRRNVGRRDQFFVFLKADIFRGLAGGRGCATRCLARCPLSRQEAVAEPLLEKVRLACIQEDSPITSSAIIACCRFRGHRDKVFDGTGESEWEEGSSTASSSLRQ
jgi:hypothetical protein